MDTSTTAKRICVCDDEVAIADLVGELLEAQGFEVCCCYSADELFELNERGTFDLFILDIMMPGQDGFACCRKIRATSDVPIIFLTAKDDEIDKVVGFELGADDYVVKPFKPRELTARVKARLRRTAAPDQASVPASAGVFEAQGVRIDQLCHEASVHDVPITLTPKEFAILVLLLKKKGTPVPSKELYEEVWQEPADAACNNTVMVHVRNLRRKIAEVDSSQEVIETVWGIGYRIM